MDTGVIRSLFADAVSEAGLHVSVTALTPSEPYKDGHSTCHFRPAQILVPVQGTVIEQLPLPYERSGTTLSYCHIWGRDLFPHLPENIEIHSFTRNVPRTKVTLPNGEALFVKETAGQVEAQIAAQRSQILETGMAAVARHILG